VTPVAEREAVAHLMADYGMSERRACRVLGRCRMTARYQTVRVDDVDLREGMKALAHKRRRFGYQRLHVLLRRNLHVRTRPFKKRWAAKPRMVNPNATLHPSVLERLNAGTVSHLGEMHSYRPEQLSDHPAAKEFFQ
jgi:hypothetical protein